MAKQRLKDLQKGVFVKFFRKSDKKPFKYEVTHIEFNKWIDGDVVHVKFKSSFGREKSYSFLSPDKEFHLWTSKDEEETVCPTCGRGD